MNTNSSSVTEALVNFCLCCGGDCPQDGLCTLQSVSSPRWLAKDGERSWLILANSEDGARDIISSRYYGMEGIAITRCYEHNDIEIVDFDWGVFELEGIEY